MMNKLKGFTLIELMIVIAIIGILVAMVFGDGISFPSEDATTCKNGVAYYYNMYDGSYDVAYDAVTGEVMRCGEY